MLKTNGQFRKLRRVFNDANHAHELTFSCYHKLPLLSKDRTREWLVAALDRARRIHNLELWAYVIMPDHVHVVLYPLNRNYSMELIGKGVKQAVSRRAIRWLRLNAPSFLKRLVGTRSGERRKYHFWQPGGGYDRNVDNADTLQKMIEYLHLNPVRKRLVNHAEDWKWSSASWYAGNRTVPLKMDGPTDALH